MKKYQLKSNRRDRSAGNGSFFTSSVAGAVALLSSLAFLVIAPGFFMSHSAFADSINMTVSDKIETNILPSASGATTGSSSSTATNISITTDSVRGYTLSLVGTGGSAAVLNGATSGTNLTSISEAKASLNDFSVNTWGYKPLKKSGANWIATGDANGNFLPGPTTTGDTIDTTSSANADANIYSISVGAKVSFAQAVDSYSNTFVLVAVGNPTPYSITYNKNTEDTVTDLPSPNPQVGSTFSDSVLLSASTPARDGYNFLNWCTTQTTDGDTCTGTSYSPGDAINIDRAAASNDVTLYAVWETACAGTMIGTTCVTYMQEMNSTIKAAMTTGTQYQLKDQRDGKLYWIAKLKTTSDGSTTEVWMTQNLDYDLSNTDLQSLSPDTSNVTAAKTVVPEEWGWDYDAAYFYEGGDYYLPDGYGAAADASGLDPDSEELHYHVGNYYSWYAATAGSGTTSVVDEDATESICPAGWRLPTSNTTTAAYSFGKMLSAQSGYSTSSDAWLLSSPLWFVRGGLVFGGDLDLQGSDGNFWSSRADEDGGGAFDLYFDSSGVSPSDDFVRNDGFSLRCVATTSPYMQDVADWGSSLAVGDEIEAIDKRDGETYLVGKLADGKIWMKDNLRLGGTTTTALTPADTNIASNYTLPASGTGNFTSSTGYTNAAINTASKNNTTTSYGSGSGKIGTYYNYCAASAGTYCYASGSGTGNAQYDVCPNGWRMPTGGGSGEYNALYTAYSSNQANFKAALSTPLSGGFGNGSAGGQGSYGYFWSSTYSDGVYMYYLYVYSSTVGPAGNGRRYGGASVRCVAQ